MALKLEVRMSKHSLAFSEHQLRSPALACTLRRVKDVRHLRLSTPVGQCSLALQAGVTGNYIWLIVGSQDLDSDATS